MPLPFFFVSLITAICIYQAFIISSNSDSFAVNPLTFHVASFSFSCGIFSLASVSFLTRGTPPFRFPLNPPMPMLLLCLFRVRVFHPSWLPATEDIFKWWVCHLRCLINGFSFRVDFSCTARQWFWPTFSITIPQLLCLIGTRTCKRTEIITFVILTLTYIFGGMNHLEKENSFHTF